MGRFLSRLDLAKAKRDLEIFNSRIKRGEIDPSTFTRIAHVACECGVDGCMFITKWMKKKND